MVDGDTIPDKAAPVTGTTLRTAGHAASRQCTPLVRNHVT